MEQNKDQSGTAVRGEAVALTDADILEALASVTFATPVRLPKGWVEFARAIERKIVSARAADAPSEPSEPTDLSHRLRETADKQPGWKQLLNAAADEIERYYGGMLAWKKTAEKKDADYNNERMDRINERCKSRAADALDSQPTAPTVHPDQCTEDQRNAVYMALHWYMQIPRPDEWKATDEAIAAFLAAAPASSQPTDGGVRNGNG